MKLFMLKKKKIRFREVFFYLKFFETFRNLETDFFKEKLLNICQDFQNYTTFTSEFQYKIKQVKSLLNYVLVDMYLEIYIVIIQSENHKLYVHRD